VKQELAAGGDAPTVQRATWAEVREQQWGHAWPGHSPMLSGVEAWLQELRDHVKSLVDADRAVKDLRRRQQLTKSHEEQSRIQREIDVLAKAIEDQVMASIPDHSQSDRTYLLPVEVVVRVRIEPRGPFAAYEPPTTWTELETYPVVVVSQVPLMPGMMATLAKPGDPTGRRIVARIDASAIVLVGEVERSLIARAAQRWGKLWIGLDQPKTKSKNKMV